MDKDRALEEFFQNFKRTFNITCLFLKDHPSFVKAIENFKNIVDTTLKFSSPLKIGVTADSFLVEAKYFSGSMYQDMAKMLHLRRVKSIEITPGVTVEELVNFFHLIAMPSKEIMASGGLVSILKREKISHISLEELDYSLLLKSFGSEYEYKDMWVYLLEEAVAQDDPDKTDALAANFGRIAQNLRIKDLLENEKLKENIQRFISYLKDKGKDKFLQCAKDMTGAILKDNEILKEPDIEKIKVFFQYLSEADFADIISEGLLSEEGFDSLSFGLFFKILDEGKHENIASLTAKTLKDRPFRDNSRVARNIQKLTSLSEYPGVSRLYRDSLSSFLRDMSFEGRLTFDSELTYTSYHSILVNLFYEEKDRDRLIGILEKLTVELDKIFRKRELGHLKFLLEAINKKRKEEPSCADLFTGLESLIYNLVEIAVCEEESPPDFQYFIDNIRKSTLGLDAYMGKIFNENKISPALLKLFLKLFSQELTAFYQNLEKKNQDMGFLVRIIESLSEVPHPLALEILKHIYSFSNNFVKREVLGAMQRLSPYDTEFLLSILRTEDFPLKREALVILRRDQGSRKKALEALFSVKSPWGRKNYIILQNILVVEQIRLQEAEPHLKTIARKHFFWNRNIKKEASRVLKKWAT